MFKVRACFLVSEAFPSRIGPFRFFAFLLVMLRVFLHFDLLKGLVQVLVLGGKIMSLLILLAEATFVFIVRFRSDVPEDSRENRSEKPLLATWPELFCQSRHRQIFLAFSFLFLDCRPEKGKGFSALAASQPCLLRFSSLGRLGCRVPRMTPNVKLRVIPRTVVLHKDCTFVGLSFDTAALGQS
ncbi:hypothetical protein Tco_1312304 [Tanacetum coccineum]